MASDASGFTYDVFLSFRGDDTRHDFTGNLWKALKDRGIRTFIDDEELRKGEEISPSLANAIQQSKIAIVVLSKNYANSSFCLEELSKILDCCIKEKGRLVWPVFYEVDPTDVRKLKGTYGEAMDMHEKSSNGNMDRFQKWKNALHQVAELSGFHYTNKDGYQYKFIEKIVEQVSGEIKPFTLYVADHLIGLEPQMQAVISLLNVDSKNKVHMVGIHGIGGIGKTTLSLAVYNSVVDKFEGSCYLEKVREKSEKHGLTHLQNILLSEIVGEKIELTSVRQGISIIQQRLQQKKVLLLLDDVDKLEQLHALVGESECFGRGSRIIITTRDKGLLKRHEVESTYEVKGLNEKDALELLTWKAFKTNTVSSSYADVLECAITYAFGLPLALEVIGSLLFKRGIEEWKYTLKRYEKVPNKDIYDILKVSFDALDEEEKSVFLDIACFLKGHTLAKVERVLHAHHGESKKYHISLLVEKSLIKISEYGEVTLHDLIEDMGKEIVRQESPEEPGKRSRLWNTGDIIQVLKENTGTSKIEIICLGSWIHDIDWDRTATFENKISIEWDGEAFKKIEKLKTLIIRVGSFSTSPRYLPNSLRILEWNLYPSADHFELDFYPKNLVECKFAYCTFTSIPGDLFKKKSENMRVLNLYCCKCLTQTPDVSGLPNLEEFSLQDCENLSTIDNSIKLLNKLKILRVEFCPTLGSIPQLIKLASLEELHLYNCYSLESFLDQTLVLEKLRILYVHDCKKLKSFPSLKLASLEELHLSGCDSLESFLDQTLDLEKLKILNVHGCKKLKSFPPLKLVSLEVLSILHCDRLESFSLIDAGLLDKLKILRVEYCGKLGSIPQLIKLASLEELHLLCCDSLESFLDQTLDLEKLKLLYVHYCEKLKSFPSLKLASLEKLVITHCDRLESFPLQDELLGKLKILNVQHCSKLKNFPPLKFVCLEKLYLSQCIPLVDELVGRLKMLSKLRRSLNLPSSEQLDFSSCDSLESFLEILEEMKSITHLCLYKTPENKEPSDGFGIGNFFHSQCGIEAWLTIEHGEHDEGEGKVGPMQSSQVEFHFLWDSIISDDSLAVGLKWFANVKELDLSESIFTILPECIKNCHFLWKLVLDNCEQLQEIKGIPPSLKSFSALNCNSLAPWCKNKSELLLNQELHEAGNTWFRVPRVYNIPNWFDHQSKEGSSTSFWFRNKFPAIALCVVSPWTWRNSAWTGCNKGSIRVTINGNTFFYRDSENNSKRADTYHLHLFHMQIEKFNDNLDKALLENKWNHAEVHFGFYFQKSGIHVLKEKRSMEDIRFTNLENDVN